MRIGIDFDNTIVCYDRAIAMLAEELFELPKELPRSKLALRDFLRAAGREPEWTAFQGELYGPGMRNAQPFDGAIATMQKLVAEGHELMIISHRSCRPYAGPPYNLHEEATNWVHKNLQSVGLFNGNNSMINFLETRDLKAACVAKLGCHAFIDDLPEVLQAPNFPSETVGILFDPSGLRTVPPRCLSFTNWHELSQILQALA